MNLGENLFISLYSTAANPDNLNYGNNKILHNLAMENIFILK